MRVCQHRDQKLYRDELPFSRQLVRYPQPGDLHGRQYLIHPSAV